MLKVSRLLAIGLEILVANAKFLVALATSWSQFRTLMFPTILLPMTSKADKTPFKTEPVTIVQVERKNLVTKLCCALPN